MKISKLLLIEDDKGFREQLKWALSENYRILEADTLAESLRIFKRERPMAVCLDMKLENRLERGLEIIEALISLNPKIKILVITGSESKELGEKAIEKGACDYLTKPIDLGELHILLSRAFRISSLQKSSIKPEPGAAKFDKPIILGKSKKIKEIMDKIKRVAQTKLRILITGESGTGKELCARAIHDSSPRRTAPIVSLNCGAIPESLMESELFGYVKGAFTGAKTDKIGMIASAHQGTLFLDEIGDMPKNLQVKLLRFIEDQKIQRIGETNQQEVDVRIIAATNNGHLLTGESTALRSDLYYRLSEFEIHLPPLRERKEDIIDIIEVLIQQNRTHFNLPELTICQGALDALMNYEWPGNIRELKNKINRASVNCQDHLIQERDLELPQATKIQPTSSYKNHIQEKNIILGALKIANYNISEISKKMGISRPTLYRLMQKHGISRPSKGNPGKTKK